MSETTVLIIGCNESNITCKSGHSWAVSMDRFIGKKSKVKKHHNGFLELDIDSGMHGWSNSWVKDVSHENQ